MAMRLGKTVGGTIRDYIPDAAGGPDAWTTIRNMSDRRRTLRPQSFARLAICSRRRGSGIRRAGTRAVPEAMVKLGRELGVEFITPRTEVERLLIQDRERPAAKNHGTVYYQSAKRISASMRWFQMKIRCTHLPRIDWQATEAGEGSDKEREYEPACSGVVLYLGLNKRYEHLAHHCFVFSRDPEEEFHHIYDLGQPAPDPTCYLASTTRTEAATAPEGGDALYVLVHTPLPEAGT